MRLLTSFFTLSRPHRPSYNAIYSAGRPAPSALYWEVASGVANFDLFQPPAFFEDLILCGTGLL